MKLSKQIEISTYIPDDLIEGIRSVFVRLTSNEKMSTPSIPCIHNLWDQSQWFGPRICDVNGEDPCRRGSSKISLRSLWGFSPTNKCRCCRSLHYHWTCMVFNRVRGFRLSVSLKHLTDTTYYDWSWSLGFFLTKGKENFNSMSHRDSKDLRFRFVVSPSQCTKSTRYSSFIEKTSFFSKGTGSIEPL